MRSSIPVAVTRMSSSMRTWRKEREEEKEGEGGWEEKEGRRGRVGVEGRRGRVGGWEGEEGRGWEGGGGGVASTSKCLGLAVKKKKNILSYHCLVSQCLRVAG